MSNSNDLNFNIKEFSVNDIISLLNNNQIKYENNGNVDSSILEFIALNTPLYPLLVKYDNSKSTDKLSYKIFKGNGILRTLKYYIIDDIPITDFFILTELNGRKFSEFPMQYQRRIKERFLTMYIDNSANVIHKYLNMIRNSD